MNSTSTRRMFRLSPLSRRFTFITIMFLTVLLGIMVYTTTTIHKENSDAILIDMAGRQRMLFEKHLNEVYLTSQGITADYKSTRKLLRSTLASLIKGGPVTLDPETGKSQTIPAVPTEEILLKLHEQVNQFDKVIESSNSLLMVSPDFPEFYRVLKTLRARNSIVIGIADDAVKQLARHSESNIETMVKWETIIAIFVGILGVYITGHGIREGRRLETQIAERKRAESALRDSELFLNSIVENIPDMIFVKNAKDLQFLRLNKAAEELLGYPKESMIGKTDYDFFPKSESDFYTTKDREVLSGKTLMDIPEEVIQTKSHGTRYLHTKKIPILDMNGTPQYLLGISEDITEQKLAKLEHTQRELLLRLIFETGPGCIKRVAADGTLLHMNPAGLELIEAKEENEAVGLSVFDLVVPEHVDAFRHMHQNVLKGEPQTLQFEIQGFKGARRWMETFAVPFSNPITKEVEQLAVTHDITERKKSEIALGGLAKATVNIKNQNFFENLVYQLASTLQVPMVLLAERVEETFPTVHASVFWYKDHFKSEFDYDCHDAPCENVFAGHPMYFPQGVQELFPKDITLKELNIESYSGTPLCNSEGGIVGNLVIMDTKPLSLNAQDNALLQIFAARAGAELERKRAQEALQESEERYRILYEDNPSMYFTVAQDGKILSVNQFGAHQLGYSVEELIGQPVIRVFFEDDKPLVQQYFNDCLQNPMKLFNWELRKQKKDGSVLWVRETVRTIKSKDEEAVVLIVCEDITERKQTEERLRESEAKETDALRQSDALKSALLSSVSHELRTPLTAMKGSISSIIGNGSSNMDQEQQSFLKGVDREINYMSHLVDNLLDMSQIEAGSLIPHKEWHLLEDLVEGALRRTAQTLDTRNIEIDIPDNVPPVFVDALEIQQVLINLLDNAVKYSSPASPIRIHARVDAQQITVEASNMGEPISPRDLERIFDRFYRRPPPRQQPIRGTGLGLAICKGIIEAHGGRIWADSIGKEVTIAFTIPIIESMPSFSLEGRHKSQRES